MKKCETRKEYKEKQIIRDFIELGMRGRLYTKRDIKIYNKLYKKFNGDYFAMRGVISGIKIGKTIPTRKNFLTNVIEGLLNKYG